MVFSIGYFKRHRYSLKALEYISKKATCSDSLCDFDVRSKRPIKGFSLIEMMVVVAIFSILAVLSTQSIATSLKSSKKSSNTISLRQNLGYVASVMDRQLHNSKGLDLPSPCTSTATSMTVQYIDQDNITQSFTCNGSGSVGYLQSSAMGRLTPPEINITNCSSAFVCSLGSPPSITVNLTAVTTKGVGTDASQLSTSTKILLRTYSAY